jgi:arylsulfatase A-like enzyme
MGNSGKSISPNINKLMDDGIILHDYYTVRAACARCCSACRGRARR